MCCGSAQQWPHMPQQQIMSLTFSMEKLQQRPNGLGWEWPTYWRQLMTLDSCGMRLVVKRYLTTGQLLKRSRERFRWASNPHYGSMSWVLYTCQDYCYVANWSLGHLTSSSLLKRSSHDVESHILLTTNWETLLPHVGSRNSSPAFHSCIHESRFAGVCNRPMYNTSRCSQQRQ